MSRLLCTNLMNFLFARIPGRERKRQRLRTDNWQSGEADEAAGGNDARPEEQRGARGKFSAPWRRRTLVPGSNIPIAGEMEEQRLQAGEKNQQHFQAEGGVGINLECLGRKQKRAGDDLEDETCPAPGQELT